MAKARAVEEKLAELSAVDLKSPGAVESLRAGLKDKDNLVAARAAQLAMRAGLADLSQDLERAFERLMAGGIAADRGCFAKKAIAEALYQLGTGSEPMFIAGRRHVQMEPVFGGEADTAVELRGVCAMGLVRIGARSALDELAELLGDLEPQARILAARALAYCGHEHAALPLRVKIMCRDTPEVMGECFAALLQISRNGAMRLIERYVSDKDDDLAAEAAMALGGSRSDEATAILMRSWKDSAGSARRHMLCTALAMTRSPEAIETLLEVLRNAPEALAQSALEALGMYRSDETIQQRVQEAARERGLTQR